MCHQVSNLWLWLYRLGRRCSLVTGAVTAGQLNADRRSGWRWEEGVSSVWDPPSTGHWGRGSGRVSPTLDEKLKGKILVAFHLLFIWMLSLLLVCLLSWNSVISLILKFKYIDFYLVYRYLFNFSVGECACVWACLRVCDARGILYEDWWGHVVLKKTRWCTGSVDGLRFLQKQSETFWFLPLSVLWFVFLSINVTAMKFSSVWINVKTKMQCGLDRKSVV